jgi:hypothetical protein
MAGVIQLLISPANDMTRGKENNAPRHALVFAKASRVNEYEICSISSTSEHNETNGVA